MNETLKKALKGYVPVFGNDEDLRIVNDLTVLQKKLGTIDTEKFRKEQAKKSPMLSAKMKEIQQHETSLITRITRRNLDF